MFNCHAAPYKLVSVTYVSHNLLLCRCCFCSVESAGDSYIKVLSPVQGHYVACPCSMTEAVYRYNVQLSLVSPRNPCSTEVSYTKVS